MVNLVESACPSQASNLIQWKGRHFALELGCARRVGVCAGGGPADNDGVASSNYGSHQLVVWLKHEGQLEHPCIAIRWVVGIYNKLIRSLIDVEDI